MAAEAESILEDIADLGRLMAVTDVPIESIVEIHGNVLAEVLGLGRTDSWARQFGAASTCLSELIVSWRIASESLAKSAVAEVSGPIESARPASFVRFLADGLLVAGRDEAVLLRDLAGGENCATLAQWVDAMVGHDRAEVVRQAVEQRRIVALELSVQTTNIHYRVVVSPYREGGGVVGVRDVTSVVLAREADFQRRKLESLGQLAGGMAHEFNNLLQPIVSLAQLAIEDFAEDSRLSEDFAMILDCAGRAAEIIRDVMVFVRHSSPDLVRISLNRAVGEELAVLRKIMPPDLTLNFQTGDGADGQVIGNRRELGQILQNLVANARDALGGQGVVTVDLGECTLAGADAVRFEVSAGRYRRLAVIDHGMGIRAAQLDRLFEPFYTTKGIGQGTGLGLSIVRSIVRSWSGGISVRSTPGLETSFEIVLPLAPPPHDRLDEGGAP